MPPIIQSTALYIGWRIQQYGPSVIMAQPSRSSGRMLKLPGRLYRNVQSPSSTPGKESAAANGKWGGTARTIIAAMTAN